MYATRDNEDLRREIYHLKKQLSSVSDENHLLKVKIRKLNNEVAKKNKQIDTILDPKQFSDVRKIVNERNASFVMNLQEQNELLISLLRDKDQIIRKLQAQIDLVKLYTHPNSKHLCKSPENPNNKYNSSSIRLKVPSFNIKDNDAEATSRQFNEHSQEIDDEYYNYKLHKDCTNDIKEQYRSLSKEHLLSIIENLKGHHHLNSRKSSPESDLERTELLCGSPHEEVKQLHLHFLDMISEVDHLKYTISKLENKQQKTEDVLKIKNDNMDKLAKEIKNLKKPKSGKAFTNSREHIARIYSAPNTRKFDKNQNKKRRNNSNVNLAKTRSDIDEETTTIVSVDLSKRKTQKITQIEENTCKYVEKIPKQEVSQRDESSQTQIEGEFSYEDDCENDSEITE